MTRKFLFVVALKSGVSVLDLTSYCCSNNLSKQTDLDRPTWFFTVFQFLAIRWFIALKKIKFVTFCTL